MRRTSTRAAALTGASILGWALIALACEGDLEGGDGPVDAAPRDAQVAPGTDGSAPGDDAGSDEDAGAGPDLDAGTTDAGTTDAGTPGGDVVPILVAQGYVGRTTISCDDGRTWIENRSMDDSLRCFQGGVDCDHHPGRAKGIVRSGGHFVATYGWGPAGGVRRSRDGVSWETTLDGTTFGGIAVLGDRVMLGARSVRVSEDEGATWSEPIGSMLSGWNVRRAGASSASGGRLILVGDGGDVTLSSDGGRTWWRPSTLPASCGANIQNSGGIGTAGGAIVIVGGDGSVCRSTDGGTTWTASSLGTSVSSSEVVEADGALLVWGGGRRFRSTDGATWTPSSLSPSGVNVGAVARTSSGAFVAVNGGWDQWYDRQRFYRSDDGVTWTELPAGAYARSHPIFEIEAGSAPRATCAR